MKQAIGNYECSNIKGDCWLSTAKLHAKLTPITKQQAYDLGLITINELTIFGYSLNQIFTMQQNKIKGY